MLRVERLLRVTELCVSGPLLLTEIRLRQQHGEEEVLQRGSAADHHPIHAAAALAVLLACEYQTTRHMSVHYCGFSTYLRVIVLSCTTF